jgi:hypothetical protein
MESGVWTIPQLVLHVEKQNNVSIMLDGAKTFRANEGGSWWATSKKVDDC